MDCPLYRATCAIDPPQSPTASPDLSITYSSHSRSLPAPRKPLPPTSHLRHPHLSPVSPHPPPPQTMSLYSTLAGAIDAYTGLSPAAFFTILALMVGIYRLVCGLFVSPDAANEHQKRSLPPNAFVPLPEPVQLGDITLEELRMYDGSDPKKQLLMAIKGQVYDVSRSRIFYGPGGPYALFAGKDASRALALMSFDPNDLTSNIEGLSSSELEVLQDWEYKFMEKYVKVGQIVAENAKNEGAESADAVGGDQDQKPVVADKQ